MRTARFVWKMLFVVSSKGSRDVKDDDVLKDVAAKRKEFLLLKLLFTAVLQV